MFDLSSDALLRDCELLHRNPSNGGCLFRLDERRIVKAFPAKRWLTGWLRIVLRRTKAHKQARSMWRVRGLGLASPQPLAVWAFAPPRRDFEGALVYDYVDEVSDAREAVRGPLRARILDRLADELVVMANANVLMVDLHLGNLLVDHEGALTWIDVEVRESRRYVERAFWPRLRRMHARCNPGVLDEREWRALCARIQAGLRNSKRYHDAPSHVV